MFKYCNISCYADFKWGQFSCHIHSSVLWGKRDRFLQGLKTANLLAKDNAGPEVQLLQSAGTKKLPLFENSSHLLT